MTQSEYDPLEKLTLLAATAIDMRHIPSAYQRLTSSDIAGKLAKVSRGASLLGRVKIAGQGEFVPDLIKALRTEVVERKIQWPTSKKTLLPVMAQTALLEVIDAKICRYCKGVSQIAEIGENGEPTGKVIVCEHCGGGRYAYTEHARARACSIHHEDWKRRYSRVYIDILTIVWTWESEVREALKA